MRYFVSQRESHPVFGMAIVYLDNVEDSVAIKNTFNATSLIVMKGVNIKYIQAQRCCHPVQVHRRRFEKWVNDIKRSLASELGEVRAGRPIPIARFSCHDLPSHTRPL